MPKSLHIPFDKEFSSKALAKKFVVSGLDITLDEETIKKLEAPYVPHIKTGLISANR